LFCYELFRMSWLGCFWSHMYGHRWGIYIGSSQRSDFLKQLCA